MAIPVSYNLLSAKERWTSSGWQTTLVALH